MHKESKTSIWNLDVLTLAFSILWVVIMVQWGSTSILEATSASFVLDSPVILAWLGIQKVRTLEAATNIALRGAHFKHEATPMWLFHRATCGTSRFWILNKHKYHYRKIKLDILRQNNMASLSVHGCQSIIEIKQLNSVLRPLLEYYWSNEVLK